MQWPDPDGTDEILRFRPGVAPAPKCPGTVEVWGRLPASVEEAQGPRYGFSAVWDGIRNQALLFGGICCTGLLTFDTVITYDPYLSVPPAPRVNCVPVPSKRDYTSAVWAGAPDRAFVFFGGDDPSVSMRQAVLYHPYTI